MIGTTCALAHSIDSGLMPAALMMGYAKPDGVHRSSQENRSVCRRALRFSHSAATTCGVCGR